MNYLSFLSRAWVKKTDADLEAAAKVIIICMSKKLGKISSLSGFKM
jgi:hypothetical protein